MCTRKQYSPLSPSAQCKDWMNYKLSDWNFRVTWMSAVPKSLGLYLVKICCVPSLKVSEKESLVLRLLWPPARHWENSGDPRRPKGGKQDRWVPQRLQQEGKETHFQGQGSPALVTEQAVTTVWLKQSWRCPESCVSPPPCLTQSEEQPVIAIVYLLMAYRLNKQREIHLLYPKAYRAQGWSMKLSHN